MRTDHAAMLDILAESGPPCVISAIPEKPAFPGKKLSRQTVFLYSCRSQSFRFHERPSPFPYMPAPDEWGAFLPVPVVVPCAGMLLFPCGKINEYSQVMRRKDREVRRREDLLAMISQCKVCRLGLWDGEEVYVVPLNFGYEERDGALHLFFHCAREGRKLDILRNNPKAAFEMDGNHLLVEGNTPCQYGYSYCSVMGRGMVEILEKDAEKIHALNRIMLHQTGREAALTPSMARTVCVLRLKAESVSGKLRARPDVPPGPVDR